MSGIADGQVTNGYLYIHVYSPKAVKLPLHSPTDPELLAKADQAYTDKLDQGFVVDDSSPSVASAFAELYNKSKVSRCAVQPAAVATLTVISLFPVFAACELLDWPTFAELGSKGELFDLAIEAAKEIQALSINGDAGKFAAEQTTGEGIAGLLAGFEQAMLPLDLHEFYRYHHGGKVQAQDHALLHDFMVAGQEEGKPMSALRELIHRVTHR
jgi:hypothetical protein